MLMEVSIELQRLDEVTMTDSSHDGDYLDVIPIVECLEMVSDE